MEADGASLDRSLAASPRFAGQPRRLSLRAQAKEYRATNGSQNFHLVNSPEFRFGTKGPKGVAKKALWKRRPLQVAPAYAKLRLLPKWFSPGASKSC